MAFDVLHVFPHLANTGAVLTPLDGWGTLQRQTCDSIERLAADLDRYSALHQQYVDDHVTRGLWPEASDVSCIGYSLFVRNQTTMVQLGVSPLGCIVFRILPKPLARLSGNLSGDDLIAFQLDEWTEFTRDECVSRADALEAVKYCLVNSRFK